MLRCSSHASKEIKPKVNQIGRELDFLNSHRDLLTSTEKAELNRVLPLMAGIAKKSESAINTLNSERGHLWTTSWPDEVEKICEEAGQVTSTLRNYSKLEKVRSKEERLEHGLSAGL
jgi:hypothetical protein